MAPVIETVELTKRYRGTTALDSLNLELAEGDVLGFLGPNGAGKSTTVGLLLGLLRPTSGRARIFGLDCRADAEQIHRRTAYVAGGTALWPELTGAETLDFLSRLRGDVDANIQREMVNRFDLDLSKRIRDCSTGTRQKVALVAALATRADLLLLDEPTAGLDPLMEREFRGCLAEAKGRGQTVLLSSHILSEVEAVCDRVAMLNNGRLVESGQLDVLRRVSAVHVHLEFDSEPPDISHIEGVRRLRSDGRIVECDIAGPIQPLLRAISVHSVNRMMTTEPSLEEIFMAHYGDIASSAGNDRAPRA